MAVNGNKNRVWQKNDQEYWSFNGRSEREFSHAFLQYPAMMVPRMQGEIIDCIRSLDPNINHVWDPFVGSGTTLAEAMLRGMKFHGNDINPLAVLVSKTKRGPLNVLAIKEKTNNLFHRINRDNQKHLDITFPGMEKWFLSETAIGLCKIRRSIMEEPSLWARRFFWVAMAECIRLTSNSRTSTYKLHLKKNLSEIVSRKNPITIFIKIVDENIRHMHAFKEILKLNGHMKKGHYIEDISVELLNTTSLRKNFIENNDVDLIVTSPPYGDNRTTVAYGQYSYLPLNWINFLDIDKNASVEIIKNTNTLDGMSLGGSNKATSDKAIELYGKLKTFKKIHKDLHQTSQDSQKKVTSFFYDLDSCIDPILRRLRKGGYMAWTLGNRSVANIKIPLDEIMIEMLKIRDVSLITKIQRKIPSKRMASRNNISDTMNLETILILKK